MTLLYARVRRCGWLTLSDAFMVDVATVLPPDHRVITQERYRDLLQTRYLIEGPLLPDRGDEPPGELRLTLTETRCGDGIEAPVVLSAQFDAPAAPASWVVRCFANDAVYRAQFWPE